MRHVQGRKKSEAELLESVLCALSSIDSCMYDAACTIMVSLQLWSSGSSDARLAMVFIEAVGCGSWTSLPGGTRLVIFRYTLAKVLFDFGSAYRQDMSVPDISATRSAW